MKQKSKSEESATRKDLSLLEESLKEEMREMRGEHKQYKDEVLIKLDDISGQLENLREDKILAVHQDFELGERVDDHEKRIKNLEKIQPLP